MANRRILKKEISYAAGELFAEVLVCKVLIPGVDRLEADKLLGRILDMQDDFIGRAGRVDGRNNQKLVKEYYRKLRTDLQAEVDAIGVEIGKLNSETA
ncbi:hypothetical protein [Parabacteroides sp. PF5-9]|uniref:hypothetical protein n=1 Tax=Parabacteroides sp. PF5-9 TaxID=1742404 RepID=UPI002473F64F|nr:hypothetical protein [Parabacteroides sp. PF5-9]MDH6357276.1 hypothetical protein [Parabacteroides sp. PF5-9]